MKSKITFRPSLPSTHRVGELLALPRGLHWLALLIATTLLVACGGGDSGGPEAAAGGNPTPSVIAPPVVSTPSEVKFTLGGSISGLGNVTGLTLVNGAESLAIATGATNFTFASQVAANTAYNVTIGTQPSGLSCSVAKGSGSATVNVNTVEISCVGAPITTLPQTRGTGLLAGNAQGDGTIANARFLDHPVDLAIDNTENLYLIERGRIRKITPAGAVTTLAGSIFNEGFSNGVGTNARFFQLLEIGVDSAGNVYVLGPGEIEGSFLIRKVTPSGVVTTLANVGGAKFDTPLATWFGNLVGMAVDSLGNVYVAENQRTYIGLSVSGSRGTTQVRKFHANGAVTTLAVFSGSSDGGNLYELGGIAVDSADNVYVKDVTASVTRKISPSGVLSTLAGNDVSLASINWGGSVVDHSGNVWRSETSTHILTKQTPAGAVLTSIDDNPGVDGVGNAASFGYIKNLAVDGTDNVYVIADNRTIRKVTPAGMVTTLHRASPTADNNYVVLDRKPPFPNGCGCVFRDEDFWKFVA